jgi:hypothetical protein
MSLVRSFPKKMFLFIVMALVALAVVPAFASATPYLTIQVNGVTQKTYATQADVAAISTVDNTTHGYLYYKNSNWYVVGTNKSITITNLFADAGVSSSWTTGKELDFTCTDGVYTKYYPTYTEVTSTLNFYPDATASTTPTTNAVAVPASLALTTGLGSTTSIITAGSVLSSMSMTNTDAPRFVMGTTQANYTSLATAGKRMPSNVTVIDIETAQ